MSDIYWLGLFFYSKFKLLIPLCPEEQINVCLNVHTFLSAVSVFFAVTNESECLTSPSNSTLTALTTKDHSYICSSQKSIKFS